MLSKDIYKSTSKLINVYYERLFFLETKVERKLKICNMDIIKILVIKYSLNAKMNATRNLVPYHLLKTALHEKKNIQGHYR